MGERAAAGPGGFLHVGGRMGHLQVWALSRGRKSLESCEHPRQAAVALGIGGQGECSAERKPGANLGWRWQLWCGRVCTPSGECAQGK